MEEILVSVILPVYNVEPYLPECLDSLVDQTLKAIEIICINDGSTDGSAAILETYAADDPRIRIIHQENRGLSETRNVGVRAASGKYLYFMDSDDILDLSALQFLTDIMEQDALDLVHFRGFAFGNTPKGIIDAEKTNQHHFQYELNETGVCSGQEAFPELFSGNFLVAFAWLNVIKRSFFTESDLWFIPGLIAEDQPWIFKTFLHAKRVRIINKILYHYRCRSSSITYASPSYKFAYSWFINAGVSQKIAAEIQPELNPEIYKYVRSQILRMQQWAIIHYRRCSPEEKLQVIEMLSADERISFEKEIVLPANLQDKQKEKDLLIKELYSSETYKVGELILRIPVKIRDLLKRSG